MLDELDVRRQVCEAGRRLWELGLVGACEGNISARISANQIVCSPTGVEKGRLEPSDLVTCDLEGRSHGSVKPSSEIRIHLSAYSVRKDCMAVVHAHPPVATALTLVNLSIPDDILPESAYVLGPVAMVPFGYPGTADLPTQLEPFLEQHKTFLLSHHGAMTLGKDCQDACWRMETLERVAKIFATARSLGQVESLPSSAVGRLRQEALTGALQ